MNEVKILEELSIRNRWAASLYPLNAFIRKDADPNKTTEVEFFAEKFQKKIAKLRGKPYDRTTITKSLRKLEQKSEGTIQILHDYKRGTYKILVHPLSFLDGKKNRDSEKGHTQNSGNPMYSEQHKKKVLEQQQQDLSLLD